MNKKTQQIAKRAIAKGVTPLEVMVQATREACEKADAVAAFAFAKGCAPFLPLRLQADIAKLRHDRLHGPNPLQLDALRAVLDEFDDPGAGEGG